MYGLGSNKLQCWQLMHVYRLANNKLQCWQLMYVCRLDNNKLKCWQVSVDVWVRQQPPAMLAVYAKVQVCDGVKIGLKNSCGNINWNVLP